MFCLVALFLVDLWFGYLFFCFFSSHSVLFAVCCCVWLVSVGFLICLFFLFGLSCSDCLYI